MISSAKVQLTFGFLVLRAALGIAGGLNLEGIGWLIAGGESGPHYRLMDENWVRQLCDLCVDEEVPFCFKQWDDRTPKQGGRLLDGLGRDAAPVSVATSRVAGKAYRRLMDINVLGLNHFRNRGEEAGCLGLLITFPLVIWQQPPPASVAVLLRPYRKCGS
jgi:hypothetical protein